MRLEPAIVWKHRVALLLLVALAALIWLALQRLEPRAEWLLVEAPREAIVGQELPLRVHLSPSAEPVWLGVDLHWGATRDSSKGYLATGGAFPAGTEGGTYDFKIRVAPRDGLRFVTGIIYLSKAGSWESRTRVAATELIPVRVQAAGELETRLEPLGARPLMEGVQEQSHPAATPRILCALLFLGACLKVWRGGQASVDPGGFGWRWLAMGLGLAGIWELLGLESWVGAQARALTHAGDIYHARIWFQEAAIGLTLAATAAFLILLRRTRCSCRMGLAFFGLYAGIAGVNLLSWHVFDQVADLSWHGWTLVQTLKLACAAMTWYGLRPER